MRFLFFLCVLTTAGLSAVPDELATALKTFRTDAPKGWSFMQTTEAEGKSRVEHYDATQPEFDRWTLLKQDGRAPTPDEQLDYKRKLTRRSHGWSAPVLTDQLDLTACEALGDSTDRATYRCKLKPGEDGDKTAEFLRVLVVVHKPSHTIESLEISSTGEFKPTFGVAIAAMKTVMTYSLPNGDTPSLPQTVTTRLRGRAFFVKSLDADMTVAYADFAKATKAAKKND